jgi:hypothetical protein
VRRIIMSVAIPVYVRDDINADMRRVVALQGVSLSQFINDAIEARLAAIKAEEWRKALEDACAGEGDAVDQEWLDLGLSQVEAYLVEYEK